MNAFFPFKSDYPVERLEAVSLVPRQIWYFPDPDNYTLHINFLFIQISYLQSLIAAGFVQQLFRRELQDPFS